MKEPKKPILRYHGGKWRIATWIIDHMPAHRIYVEPFAGAASVLLRKPRANVEVVNDLHGRLVNVFRVLRDPVLAARLERLLRLTPYALLEYRQAREIADDPVEDARRMLVLGYQAHGSTGPCGGKMSGWRRGLRPRGPSSADEWARVPDHIEWWTQRLQGVFIEHDNAFNVIPRWDTPDTLFYVDPPYLEQTRATKLGNYAYEMSDGEHRKLSELLHNVQGMVILSGYPSPLYDHLYSDWHRVERKSIADNRRPTTEALWISPNAHRDLFSKVSA